MKSENLCTKNVNLPVAKSGKMMTFPALTCLGFAAEDFLAKSFLRLPNHHGGAGQMRGASVRDAAAVHLLRLHL